MLSEGFSLFLEGHGPAPDAVRPAPATVETYRGRVPDGLIDFWLEAGWGWYAGGRLRLCDPAVPEGCLEGVFDGDPDFRPDDLVGYAYTAFGQVEAWHPEHRLVTVELPDGQVLAPKYLEPRRRRADLTAELAVALYTMDRAALDLHDEGGKPLFARARRVLGPLGPDEVYGFVPLLALGGAPRLDGLRRVGAAEHLAIAAQAQGFRLMDYSSRPARVVRDIGGCPRPSGTAPTGGVGRGRGPPRAHRRADRSLPGVGLALPHAPARASVRRVATPAGRASPWTSPRPPPARTPSRAGRASASTGGGRSSRGRAGESGARRPWRSPRPGRRSCSRRARGPRWRRPSRRWRRAAGCRRRGRWRST